MFFVVRLSVPQSLFRCYFSIPVMSPSLLKTLTKMYEPRGPFLESPDVNMNHSVFEIKELKVNLMALRQFCISDGSSSVLLLLIHHDYIYFVFTFHDFKLRNRF